MSRALHLMQKTLPLFEAYVWDNAQPELKETALKNLTWDHQNMDEPPTKLFSGGLDNNMLYQFVVSRSGILLASTAGNLWFATGFDSKRWVTGWTAIPRNLLAVGVLEYQEDGSEEHMAFILKMPEGYARGASDVLSYYDLTLSF